MYSRIIIVLNGGQVESVLSNTGRMNTDVEIINKDQMGESQEEKDLSVDTYLNAIPEPDEMEEIRFYEIEFSE